MMKLTVSFSRVFFTNSVKTGNGNFRVLAITREPIEIQIHTAPKNDRLNLLFMKDIYVGAPKTARNSLKTVIYESQILRITL